MQLVIAEMTTLPSLSSKSCPLSVTTCATAPSFASAGREFDSASPNIVFDLSSGTRSWGRAGPARLGTTLDRSRESFSS